MRTPLTAPEGDAVETSAHPDLASLGRRLRDRMDRTLEAEMEAARCAARRNRSLRDVFLAAEDAASAVRLTATDGGTHCGRVSGVGVDHVEIESDRGLRIVAFPHVVSVDFV